MGKIESSWYFRAILCYRGKMGNRIIKLSNVKKTIHYLRKNGIRHTFYAAKERIGEEKREQYVYQEPDEARLAAQKRDGKRFPYRFSIVVPAYETKESYLRELINSVRRQSYERWELVIADASAGERVEEIAAAYQKKERESRIRYLRLPENRGISENTNAGIEEAAGDYIGLLDHDDFLAPDALYEMALAIYEAEQKGITPVLLYSDEDKYEDNICYKTPNRKKNFNLDLILSNNYVCHFMVVRADRMKALRLRKAYDGAQDYDLVLRIVHELLLSTPGPDIGSNILHIPEVLYHWRCHDRSTADNTASKLYAYDAGKAALEDFGRTQGWNIQVSHSLHLGFYRIQYLPDIFAVRGDVGMIGGRILDGHNKITSGIYDEEGNRLYQGLHKEYSGGSTHLAVLMQDCAAVDIRCMRIRRELQSVFTEITGVSYAETGKQELADVSGISCDEEGYRKLSMELGRAARAKGYRVVWTPQLTLKK
ncbi:MAG: glycosyltransferase [Blautia sp.]|nr:glycosyltransferase [Blautia sp.]MCM1199633.1 glycosyltransferase [Bacteroides fragilis]